MGNRRIREAIDRVLAMWESGEMPAAVARTWIRPKVGDRPSDSWSFINRLVMLANGTEDARGFRQRQQVNRWVKKGARAFYILGPVNVRYTVETEDGEEETRYRLVGFKDIPVFRYEDTEGEPLPEAANYEPPEPPPLREVADSLGVTVEYVPRRSPTGAWGTYYPGRGHIQLRTHEVKTWFHELAHAVHGQLEQLKPRQDVRQEIIAETVAVVLCYLYDVEGFERHGLNYVRSYVGQKKDPVRVVTGLLSTIEQVLERLLEEAEAAEQVSA